MKNPTTPATPSKRAVRPDATELFMALRGMILPYAPKLLVVHDDDAHFYANCANLDAKGKPQFFGAVKASGRRHVFHFMPVYDYPELLAGISPALRKHMQGKSCFNFDALDQDLLHELQLLIEQGVARYTAAGRL